MRQVHTVEHAAFVGHLLEQRRARDGSVEHELVEVGLVGDGVLDLRLNVLGSVMFQADDCGALHANAMFAVAGQRLRIQRDVKLFFVRRANHPVAPDARPQKHRGTNGPMILAIALVAFAGPSLVNVMVAIGAVYVATIARITRAGVLTVRTEAYVEAARGLGRHDLGIMRRHVLPNALAPALVQLTLGMARAILYEASLSFIGLGTPPPTPSWGRMLADTKSLVQLAPWTSVGCPPIPAAARAASAPTSM